MSRSYTVRTGLGALAIAAQLVAATSGSAAPLPAAPSWTAESNQVGAWFGRSVATAGDVNGDGFSDFIVGAFEYTNDQATEGAAFVYLGAAGGLDAAPDWIVEGDEVGANCGESVAAAGDVDGDGFDDVLVGVPGAGTTGEARVYLGSAAGLASSPDWILSGSPTAVRFGASVAGAGDVNGDGFADVLVGDPSTGGTASLYLGSADGLDDSPAWIGECDQPAAYYGVVAGAGDVNGDGFDDFAVGASRYTNGEAAEGMVFVYHGGPSGPGSSASWTAESNDANADFGSAVATAGDVNGDGFADLAVGAATYGGTDAGRAYVFRGSAIGLEANAAWIVNGAQASERYGYSVATAGDVNADGFADVVVGALDYDNPLSQEGRALLYLGAPTGLATTAAWSAEGNQSGAFFGISVATAGDVNGDGMSDVAIGAFRYDNGETDEGRAFVYHGATAPPTIAPSWIGEANQANAYLGTSVAFAGDVNGDGLSDLIAGAPNYDLGETDEGRALLFHGTATGPSAAPVWAAEGNQSGCHFGAAASGAGDVNGDGYVDVIVGAPDYSGRGRAFVFHGSASGVASSPAWTADGDQDGAQLGATVTSAGDVNGDGFGDILIGAPLYDNGQTNEGRAYLYLGSADGLNAAAEWTAEGDVANGEFGRTLSSAGDVNGDGRSDVIVGAPMWTDNYPAEGGEGAAFVFHGSAAGLDAVPAWLIDGDLGTGRYATSVSDAGDVNGDGFGDVIVGAPGQNFSDGFAFVYFGSAGGLAGTPAWTGTANSGMGNSNYGVSVADAGDANGDGFSDVIVGAPFWWMSSSQSSEGAAFIYFGSPSGPSASHVWMIEGNGIFRQLGQLVAGAGDANGDGLSEIAYGIQWDTNGQANEGRVFVHLGNERDGLDLRVTQRRSDDAAPIAILGVSDSPASFGIAALARSAAGRQRVALEWEVKPLGTPFDGTGLARSPIVDTGAPDADGSAAPMSAIVEGLDPDTPYAWRVRVVSASPLFPHSLWLSLPENGRAGTDVRTADAPVGIADEGATPRAWTLRLGPSVPNPFNPRTTLSFELTRGGPVEVRIFDTAGRLVAVPMKRFAEAGLHRVAWEARRENGTALPSGVYAVQVVSGGEVASQKIMLLK
jgi:hypothetical protein